jgi:hypothetical protein
MIRRQCLGFALEACQPLGIVRKGVRQHLDRDLAPEARIRGAIDLPHATHADLGGDLIRAETGARSQRHGRWPRL